MAVSKIQKNYLIKRYDVTTAANPNVSPFGAYADKRLDVISGYTPIMADLEGLGSVNPSATRMYGTDGVFIWTKSAITVVLKVLYIKN